MTPAREALLGGRASSPALFVAIPTGQVVANLLPLFELADEGDSVLWLATAEAARQEWVARSERAVATRHPTLRQIVIRDLPETLDLWRVGADSIRRDFSGLDPVYLLNGGTKLMNFAVAEIFRQAGLGAMPVAYAVPPPTPQLVLQPAGPGGPTHRFDYAAGRHPTLDELLAVHGYRRLDAGQPLWRAGDKLPGPTAEADGYGTDPRMTGEAHAAAHAWATRARLARTDPPAFAQAGFDEAAIGRLFGAVAAFQNQGAGPPQLEILFNTFRRAMLDAKAARRRRAEMAAVAGGMAALPPAPLGARFERAVTDRLLAILRDDANAHLRARIAEIWVNVRLAEAGNGPERHTGELDIVVLSRHATALVLECKSGFANYGTANEDATEDPLGKDIHARAWRLQRACGGFAKVLVCLPFYDLGAAADWQTATLDRWRQSLHGRHETIFFTLPGQAAQTLSGTADSAVNVPPFEAELNGRLSRF